MEVFVLREFFEQVKVDKKKKRFFVSCPVCNKRHYGAKLPFLCRVIGMPELTENGRAGFFRRRAYRKCHVVAVQALSRDYNYCCYCGEWVCDDCFGKGEADDRCIRCVGTDLPENRK